MTSHRGRAHVAVLVLLAATARAGVVAADLLAAVADWLDLFLLAACVCRYLIGRRHRAGGTLLRGHLVHPDRLLNAAGLLHAEDVFGDASGEAVPHHLEFLHALLLVLRLRILLTDPHQVHRRAQMI